MSQWQRYALFAACLGLVSLLAFISGVVVAWVF